MKVVRVCVVVALMMVLGYAQNDPHDSDRVRVVALENAWNEAEKNKDGKQSTGYWRRLFLTPIPTDLS